MRITSEMMVANSMRRLSSRLEQYERSQSELASGRTIMRPSDDPGNAGRAMTLRAQMRSQEQEQRNITDASSWLETTDSHLQTSVARLHRARELAVRGASSQSRETHLALKAEVDEIRDELISVANARYRGRPVFAGFSDDAPVTDATPATVSSGGDIIRRIGEDEKVRVNVLAEDAFGPTGNSVFDALTSLSTALDAGDTAASGAAIDTIDAARNRIGEQLAQVGSAMNRVESAARRNADMAITLRTELSEVQDVDVAEAMMELQLQQVAYEATLGALGKALPTSLVAFLR